MFSFASALCVFDPFWSFISPPFRPGPVSAVPAWGNFTQIAARVEKAKHLEIIHVMKQKVCGFVMVEVKGHKNPWIFFILLVQPHSKKQFHLDLYRRYIPIMPETVWKFWQNNIILLGPDVLLDLLAIFEDVCFWTCLKIDSFFFSASWDWNLVRLTQSCGYLSAIGLLAYDETTHEQSQNALNLLEHLPKVKWRYRIWLWTKDIYNSRCPNTWTWFYDWSHLLDYWTWKAQ